MLGISFLPAIAYKVTDKLSLGAGLNAMYGYYKNEVAINNILPAFGDGSLKLDDTEWGWGANLGLLYEVNPDIRLGFTWNSQVNLDFSAPAEFSNLAPGIRTLLHNRGLLNADIDVGINVPQQAMGSIFAQVNDRWAVLASVGWQQWSKFGQVALGVDDVTNPTSITTDLDFKDTWHGALGAQYRLSQPWLLNFGIAYDSAFQDSSKVSPLLPLNAGWRFGVGAEHQASETFSWGVADRVSLWRDARHQPSGYEAGRNWRAWRCRRFLRQYLDHYPRPLWQLEVLSSSPIAGFFTSFSKTLSKTEETQS